MSVESPIVTVYCDGQDIDNPHPRFYFEPCVQDLVHSPSIRESQIRAGLEPQPHYWRAAADQLLIEDVPADEIADDCRPSPSLQNLSNFRHRWRFNCDICPYDLVLNRKGNFGKVNGLFDRLVAARPGKAEISLRLLDHLTK